MSDIVVQAENISKKYVIGHQVERGGYMTLRDMLMKNTRNLWNKTKDLAKGKPIIQGDTMEEVWALKDVSFEIRRGEAMGIIGRNGAGKSTLLKILSRITEPSTGRVIIKGRVASLLEVGTGFHPELTGRENIYLNGTILGMTRNEIARKFDEIVAFAEVEKYLDTPVKRYSSGMYVRLAFAVAAHLEPEILLVDEVLAVGDLSFQKKCLGKMNDVASRGRTVLFVSHNMPAVQSLCRSAILLANGKVLAAGQQRDVVATYLTSQRYGSMTVAWDSHPGRQRGSYAVITGAEILDERGNVTTNILLGAPFTVRIYLDLPHSIRFPALGLGINNAFGQRIVGFNTGMSGITIPELRGKSIVSCQPLGLHLAPGSYYLKLVVHASTQDLDSIDEALNFTVVPTDFFGSGQLPDSQQGAIVCKAIWNVAT